MIQLQTSDVIGRCGCVIYAADDGSLLVFADDCLCMLRPAGCCCCCCMLVLVVLAWLPGVHGCVYQQRPDAPYIRRPPPSGCLLIVRRRARGGGVVESDPGVESTDQ